jgi:hypothetical protein
MILASIALAGCGGTDADQVRQTASTEDAMANTGGIRKQVYDLLPRDLERFPIWEHTLDEEGEPGQDEATVKPRPDLAIADPGEDMLIARAEFIANDGTRFDGYVYPSDEHDFGFIQPTIVTDDGQVNFWYGAFPPKPGELGDDYNLVGKTADQLFPVKFRASVEYEGAKLEGAIPAFMHYRDVGSDEVVEVK